ncbi:MAG: OmpA family protein [Pseudomonadota bacterium]
MKDNQGSDMSDGVAQLKDILLDDERGRIEELGRELTEAASRLETIEEHSAEAERKRVEAHAKLEEVYERSGSAARFRSSVADVLDEAIEEAESTRHDKLTRAMAPLVIGTVKAELRNSQDEMVDALYPLTGRMVRRYVTAALKELAENVNRRLERNPISLRLRSIFTGRPVSELAMVGVEKLDVEEVYLIRRGSGELLARWPARAVASNHDVHMSGVLSAINDFATHAFQADGGEVRNFASDDFLIFMRASPLYLVAAKCKGIATATAERVFDEEFVEFLHAQSQLQRTDSWHDDTVPETRHQLGLLAEAVESRVAEARQAYRATGSNLGALKVAAVLIAVPLLGWLAWTLYTNHERNTVDAIAHAVITETAELNGYPTVIETGYRGRTIKVTGLVPSVAVRDGVVERLGRRLPADTELDAQLSPLPEISSVEQQITEVQASLARRSALASLSRARDRLQAASNQLQLILKAFESADEPSLLRSVSAEDLVAALKSANDAKARIDPLYEELTRTNLTGNDLARVAGRIRASSRSMIALADQISAALGRTATERDAPRPAASSDVVAEASAVAILADRIGSQTETLAQLSQARPPKMAEPTLREQITRWAQSHAVFFSDGTTFRNPDRVAQALDTLARLMKSSDVMIRVVGYTDERGGSARNIPLGQARADKVEAELLARGVRQQQVTSIGRASIRDLSDLDGRGSPNRRVEFEVGFVGEANPSSDVEDRPTDR